MPLPERIQNAPSLLPGLDLYFLGFEDLKSSRMTGFGPGPIWWGTIQEYCEKKGLSEEQTFAMHFHINVLDSEYLQFMSKKHK